jgi:hypothetical protein
MATGHPLSPAEHGRIQTLHQQGTPARAIAAAMSCSLSAVHQSLADARIGRGRVGDVRALVNSLRAGGDGTVPPRLSLPVDVVVNRYLAGESILSLAGSYQVSRGEIRQLLADAEVTIQGKRHRLFRNGQPWGQEEGATALRLRAQGLDACSIGLRICRTTRSVQSWLEEHDRPVQAERMAARARRRRGELLPDELPPAEVIEALRTGWRGGRTIAALAREHSIPTAVVSGVLKHCGVVVRPGPRADVEELPTF